MGLRILMVSGLLALGACTGRAAEPSVREYLDPRAAVTVTASAEVVLERTEPWVAAHGRSLAGLTLVELNRAGRRQWLLRVTAWGTVDRQGLAASRRERFARGALFADGEPIDLAATGWSDADLALAEAPHPLPVPTATVAWYELTRSAAARIAGAGRLELLTGDPDNAAAYAAGPSTMRSTGFGAFARYLDGQRQAAR